MEFLDYGGRQGGGDDGNFKRYRNDNYRNKKFHRDKSNDNSGSTFPTFNAEVLCESEIGVTEYISDHEGFSGIIKARYCDFHVNEIDQDGVVVKLTSKAVPKDPVKGQKVFFLYFKFISCEYSNLCFKYIVSDFFQLIENGVIHKILFHIL